MTCIVGYIDKKNDTVWMGSDSMGSNGYTHELFSVPKVFRQDVFKNVIMGVCGSYRSMDLLRYSESLFPELDWYKKKDEIDHKYMVKTFIPNVIKLLQENQPDENETSRGCNFLVGVKNQLFEIQNDYSVLTPIHNFASVGSGEVAAIGSLITTNRLYGDKMKPENHILHALRAATEYCMGVGAPYHLINTKEEDKIYTFDE